MIRTLRSTELRLVLTGIAAAVVSFGLLDVRERASRRETAPVRVLVAAVDLPAGTPLHRDLLISTPVPQEFVPPGAMKPSGLELIEGLPLQVSLTRGEPVRWAQLKPTPPPPRIKVDHKLRALTVRVHSLNGWVRPNDHVDLIGTMARATKERIATTVMQDAMVVRAQPIAGPDGRVTEQELSLWALPEEVERTALVDDGHLTVMIRNPDDREHDPPLGAATLATMLSGERQRHIACHRYNVIWDLRSQDVGTPHRPAGSTPGLIP